MNLLKTTGYTSLSTLFKLISGFIIGKLVAIYVGPSGLGLVGQFQSFMQVISNLSSAAINQGVLKYTAEFKDDKVKLKKVWSTALKFSLSTTLLVAVILLLFNNKISLFLFKTNYYNFIFVLLSATLLFYVLNNFILAILNGRMEIKKLTVIKIAGSLFSLVITGSLVYFFQLTGALIAIVTTQTLVFFVSFFFITKSDWFRLSFFTGSFDYIYFKKLLRYTLMAVVSALFIPFVQIKLRNHIAGLMSWQDVGYWEGVVRISNYYMLFITSSLTVYYLPKLSSLKTNFELKREILNGYKVYLPFIILLAVVIYFSRHLIIFILFTEEFIPMERLFLFQLIGDTFKIAAFLLANMMWAKAMMRLYIITEIFFVSSYWGLSVLFISHYGLIGITYAYCLNYFLYLLTVSFLFREVLLAPSPKPE